MIYQFSPMNFYRRPGGGPLTCPMSKVRKIGDNITRYSWIQLEPMLKSMNTWPDALKLISAPDWGPSKGLDGDKIRWIGLIWPGRNVVQVDDIVDDWGLINGVLPSSNVNKYDHPHLVHQVYDFNSSQGWGQRAKPVWVPILGGPWWVPMERLQPLGLPKEVTVTAFPNLRIRTDANGEVIGSYIFGSKITIIDVKIAPGGIWGKTDKGWVALRFNDKNYTSWKV